MDFKKPLLAAAIFFLAPLGCNRLQPGVAPLTLAPLPPTIIDVTGFSYPATITIQKGGSIVWENNAFIDLSIMPDDGHGNCTVDHPLPNGGAVTLSFTTPGTYHYHTSNIGGSPTTCGTTTCDDTCTPLSGVIIVQ